MKNLVWLRWYRSLYLPSNRLFYLAVFRVLLGLIILIKIAVLHASIKFLYEDNRLLDASGHVSMGFIPWSVIVDHVTPFYIVFSVAVTLMVFGVGRRWPMVVVLLCLKVHNDMMWILLDGGDNLMQFSLLYLFFANSFSYLSFHKTSPSLGAYSFSNLLTNLAVAAIIGHLSLAYMISGLSKAHAEVWYNGTALYYILQCERFQGTKTWNELFAINPVFNVLVCYTTIILESTFPFAVFVKRLRIPVLLMGVGMHLSIFLLMMIQSFQFIFIFHYGFFFTDDEWLGFLERIRLRLGLSPKVSGHVKVDGQVA